MKFKVAISVMVFFWSCSYAVEIPLGQAGVIGSAQGSRFGVVDIEEVLETFPETKKKEAELKKIVDDANAQIREREAAIDKLRIEIESLEKNLSEKQSAPPASNLPREGFVVLGQNDPAAQTDAEGQTTDTQTPPPADTKEIEAKKKELEAKVAELGEFRENARQGAESTKRSFTQSVMGKIYAIIEEVAKEESIQIIVDKNNILYGRSEIDLTGKITDRLSGKR